MYKARIAGVGHYVPEKIVNNFDLEKMMDTSDEWIRERSGIQERRYVVDGENNVDMAEKAVNHALERAGMSAEEIDFIVYATLSPEYFFPGSGCLLQERLGIPGVGALDIRTQCTGFVYGVSVADQFIKTGMYKNILVVGSEVQTRGLNLTTEGRDVAVLFGDGAGAVIMVRSEDDNRGVLSAPLHPDGRYIKELWCEDPGSIKHPRVTHEMIDADDTLWPHMNGKNVFKHAITKFPAVILQSIESAGVQKDDVDLVIPHQANMRITEAVRHKLQLPPEKVYSNIHKYGNTTAASIPIAMSEALDEGLIKENFLICIAAFGSGFTWASAMIRW